MLFVSLGVEGGAQERFEIGEIMLGAGAGDTQQNCVQQTGEEQCSA